MATSHACREHAALDGVEKQQRCGGSGQVIVAALCALTHQFDDHTVLLLLPDKTDQAVPLRAAP
jgi:hypothetical protein